MNYFPKAGEDIKERGRFIRGCDEASYSLSKKRDRQNRMKNDNSKDNWLFYLWRCFVGIKAPGRLKQEHDRSSFAA